MHNVYETAQFEWHIFTKISVLGTCIEWPVGFNFYFFLFPIIYIYFPVLFLTSFIFLCSFINLLNTFCTKRFCEEMLMQFLKVSPSCALFYNENYCKIYLWISDPTCNISGHLNVSYSRTSLSFKRYCITFFILIFSLNFYQVPNSLMLNYHKIITYCKSGKICYVLIFAIFWESIASQI